MRRLAQKSRDLVTCATPCRVVERVSPPAVSNQGVRAVCKKQFDDFGVAFVGGEDEGSHALRVDPVDRRTDRDQAGCDFEMAVTGSEDQRGVAGAVDRIDSSAGPELTHHVAGITPLRGTDQRRLRMNEAGERYAQPSCRCGNTDRTA